MQALINQWSAMYERIIAEIMSLEPGETAAYDNENVDLDELFERLEDDGMTATLRGRETVVSRGNVSLAFVTSVNDSHHFYVKREEV